MFDELNSVCVACEGIVCGERVEVYNAMVQFVLENTSKRSIHDINVVAADGVLNQEKVANTLGLPNAIYTTDVYHLYWTQYYQNNLVQNVLTFFITI